MKKSSIQSGEIFGRLKAIRIIGSDAYRGRRWLCICSCPNKPEVEAYASALKSGKVQSCGCIRKKQYFAFGKDMTLDELIKKSKDFHDKPLSRSCVYSRLSKGWRGEEAVKAPRRSQYFESAEGSVNNSTDFSVEHSKFRIFILELRTSKMPDFNPEWEPEVCEAWLKAMLR